METANNPTNVSTQSSKSLLSSQPGTEPTHNGLTGTVGAVFGQTKRFVADGYNKTTDFLGNTTHGAINMGKRHPGKTALITFGLGVGTGVLLMKAFAPKPKPRLWFW